MIMRRVLVSMLAVALTLSASAQSFRENGLFNHLSVGVTAGTPGWGIDVAMPVCEYVSLRAGFTSFPTIKVNTDLDLNYNGYNQIEGYNIPSSIEVEGKPGFTNGKLLADVFPFKSSSFHVTVGAYFGSSSIVKAYNKEDGVLKGVADYNNSVSSQDQKIGVELGDYLLEPDDNGNVNAAIKTASFKPYVGLGFGRAVPRNRVGFMFEMGVMFWGSPKVYCNDVELTSEKLGADGGDVLKYMSKVSIYPVLNFRLCGKIF